jgi:hypothetical protein
MGNDKFSPKLGLFSGSDFIIYAAHPDKSHWQASKRIFRYIQGTLYSYIQYSKTIHPKSRIGYSDAYWGRHLDTRRSTSCFCFILSGGAISWSSRKQKSVALSSTKVGYMALTHCTTEAIWLC